MTINLKTGVEDVMKGGGMRLHPNPNNGTFSLSLPPAPSQGGGDMFVQVVNVVGQGVFEEKVPNTNSKFQIALPENVANGVYLLKLRVGDEVHTARFTVRR